MQKDELINILRKYKSYCEYRENIKEIGLFGSYAKDTFNEKSDIDIFINYEPANMFDLITIKEELEKLLKKKIDLVTIHKNMNQYLFNEIKTNGIYV